VTYRVQVYLRNAELRVYIRRGNDWTNRFKKIAADAWHIDAGSAISTARSWSMQPTASPTSPCFRMS
jgi:hypothetical protein